MARQAPRRPSRPRREGRGCAPAVAALIFVAALVVLVYAFAIRPMLSRAVADQIAGPTLPVPTLMPAGAPSPAAQSPQQAAEQAAEQAGAAIPAVVAALPTGEVAISDAQVNDLIAARPDAIAPLESASIRFTTGAARAELRAYGVSSGATIGLAAQDGQVVVTSVKLDAPLAVVISGDEIARTLVARLNDELAAQGRRVDELRIEEGQMVLVTS